MRFVGHDDGVVIGWPHVLVEDRPEHVILYQPSGVRVVNVRRFEGTRDAAIPKGGLGNVGSLPPDYYPPVATLRVLPRDAEHAVEVYLGAEGEAVPSFIPWLAPTGRVRGWKVNLQAQFVAHELGFDTTDNCLDVVVDRERRWQWKDEDLTAARVAAGLTTEAEFRRFRAEGERVIAKIEAGVWPFIFDWEDWKPEPSWILPVLPEGWADLPGYRLDLNRVRPD